jgi:hypothetical protein
LCVRLQVQLTDENFSQVGTDNQPWFVKFFAPVRIINALIITTSIINHSLTHLHHAFLGCVV